MKTDSFFENENLFKELIKEMPSKSVQERIEESIEIDQETGCHNWNKCLQNGGYGQMGINGKMKSVHRVSYELHNGKIPVGMCVLHRCDNPKCCNPEHLFVGTHQDNTDDKMAKGRQASILTLEKVKEIRKKFVEISTCKQLALEYGVCYHTIRDIIANRTWKE